MNKKNILAIVIAAAFVAVLALAQTTSSDTAKDPVCGMSVKKAGAKYTFDYKGTTYYFCSEGCKTSFSKDPDKYLKPSDAAKPMGQGMMGMGQMGGQVASPDTAIDPVCGMSVKKAGAKYTYDYKGTTYYFCSEGCKTSFSKDPDKYLKPSDVTKPMGQGMMGQHMQMGSGQQAAGGMDNCPMMMKDVEKKVVNTKDGVTITLSSKNAATVKKIQDWAAEVAAGGTEKKMSEAGCPMGADCPMKKK